MEQRRFGKLGDPTKDLSVAWPDERKVVDLGVLTVDKAVPGGADAEKKLLFLPSQSDRACASVDGWPRAQ